MKHTRHLAVIRVDLAGGSHVSAHHNWPYPHPDDSIFESGMANLLDFLAIYA